jgi:hypothetical protein
MVRAVLVRSSHQRSKKGLAMLSMLSMPQWRDFRSQLRNRPVKRWVILLAGVIAIALLAGCDVSPQSLGITGPGDQQKSPGDRNGIKSQHNLPFSGGFAGSQAG